MARYDFSKGFDRLSKAMGAGGNAEVPVIIQMHEFSMMAQGISGRRFYHDAETFVKGICDTTQEYGFDTPGIAWDAYNIEAEALGVPLIMFDEMAPALDNIKPFIRTEKDLARLRAPDPASDGRMALVVEMIRLAKTYTGQDIPLSYCAPFTMAAHLLTFEMLVVYMQKDPAFVHKVLDFVVDEVLLPFLKYAKSELPDMPYFDGSDATASLPFITWDMQQEFSADPINRLRRKLVEQNIGADAICDNWWGDDSAPDLERYWDRKLTVTPNFLKIQDPDLWRIGTDRIVPYARKHDLPIVLGVDNNVFQNASEIEIRQRIHEYLDVIEENDKRGALYFCSLSAVTPKKNVRIAVDAVRQYRQGDRPWAGEHRAGTPEARGEAASGSADNTTISMAQMEKMAAEATPEDALLDAIFDTILDADDAAAERLVKEALHEKVDLHEILNDALISAMDEVGEEFSKGTIFVPEMLMSARAMKSGLEVLRPLLSASGAESRGLVVLATVQGDVHDIGKNLVGMMLEGAGYDVIDLGVNMTPEDILAQANKLEPAVVGLSALLTTSMPSMQKTVGLFKSTGSKTPVIIGGAPVTQEFSDVIGADGCGENAPHAVELVNAIVGTQMRPADYGGAAS
jgi:methylmalonyl-CoA mutase cobalamin-binding domain/chain